MCYRQARFMIQPFFFLRKQDLLIFEVLRGVAVIHDAGCSVFKKLISDFNVSLVDVNISGRKETGRGECYRKELFTHTQRIELILWLGRFYPLPCLSRATFCLSLYVINVQSSQQLIHTVLQSYWEKKKTKKSSDFLFRVSQGFLCNIIRVFASNLYSCFHFIFGFLEDLENIGQIY